ncbi:MAG: DUF460 domain-containing protein [Ignisphaera sp.]|uniref:DUF460 domain-containing protein n=1 Tax=Ignisphaera aggregans TaxID=334771 RepID=A0A7J3MZB0_9CREN
MKILGLDIVKGSPLSRTVPPRYSVVIIDDEGKVMYESPEASLSTIIKLSWEYSIDRIGLDNIYELAPTSQDIARILSLFPSHTEVYQVTLNDNVFTSLLNQVSKLGISISYKPTSLQTAYLCALIALQGLGTPIKGVERKTKIIISRAKSIGPGGSSSNRFARGMRTAILATVKEIKSLLEREKLDYDLVIRKGSGGLDSAVFTVYTDSETVRKVIRPYKGRDIRIIVRPIYSSITTISNDDIKRRPLIIGIDPGIETGLALIDLSLNIVLLESSKNLDRIEIINKIYNHGLPVLVAVDTNPPPESAKKISSILGVPLYTPSESLTIDVKDKLIEWIKRKKRIELNISTSHEKDALAAAIKAYKSYERKLLELEKKLLELEIDVDLDELKAMILKGKNINEVIEYSIEKHLEGLLESNSSPKDYSRQTIESDERIKNLEARLLELTRENESLKLKLRELENKLRELEFEKKFQISASLDLEAHRDRILTMLKEQVKQLRNTIIILKNENEKLVNEKMNLISIMSKIISGRYIGIPKIKNLALSNLHSLKELVSRTKILAVSEDTISLEVIDILKQYKILILFEKCSENVKQLLLKNDIPVECNIKINHIFDDFILVNSDDLEQSLFDAVSTLYSSRGEKRLDLNDIIRIVSEYRNYLYSN